MHDVDYRMQAHTRQRGYIGRSTLPCDPIGTVQIAVMYGFMGAGEKVTLGVP